MGKINKTAGKYLALISMLVIIFTAFQGVIGLMPVKNELVISIISAIVLFLVSTLTAWQQYLSKLTDNKALIPTLILCAIALVGGLNDVFNVIPMSEIANQWVRFVITFVTMILNLTSNLLFPKDEIVEN